MSDAEGHAPSVPTTFPRTVLGTGSTRTEVEAERERRNMRLLTPAAHGKLEAARAKFGR